MKSSIVVLISVLAVGSIVIFLGFITNQEYIEIFEIFRQYENLEKYKNELEKTQSIQSTNPKRTGRTVQKL